MMVQTHVDDVNTFHYSKIVAVRLKKKPKGSYHHPDLEHALVDAALETIRAEGIAGLTLRGVGARLGVSRTALYRHFAGKSALLARLAREGFHSFRNQLQEAVDSARGDGRDPLEEMGIAYVGFAMANQAHYQTMFGGGWDGWDRHPDLVAEADAAFMVLLNAIGEEQRRSRIAAGDPLRIAQVIWSSVHGMATLAMAGQLKPDTGGTKLDLERLIRFNARVLRKGLARQ